MNLAPATTSLRSSRPRLRDVELRVRRPGALRVEVAGELCGWWAPRALHEREPGVFVGTFALPEGAYEYKLKVDDVWELDDANARTRASGPFRNNVLAVGAVTGEPVLFAASPPFVYAEDGGGVVVTAGLRRGMGSVLEVLWTEDPRAAERRTRMALVAEEEEHDVYRVRLPVSAERLEIAFAVDGTRVAGDSERQEPFVVERGAEEHVPAWWRDAVVYAVFVDRFRPAFDVAGWERDPGPDRASGGHLDGIARSLREIAELGANTLYLTPCHVAASAHRYDVVDPLAVDPALGGEAAFARLVDEAHARGVRVIVDFALGHAGRGFPAYEDVLAGAGRDSESGQYFLWTEGGELRCYGARVDAPLFDLDARAVRAMALEAVRRWAERGVDGIRLDAAADVPVDLARALRAKLKELRPDAVVVGEVVPEHAWRWRLEGAVDAATEFAFQRASNDLFARGVVDAAAAMEAIKRAELARGGPASTALRFVSTHDHVRFATLAAFEQPQNAALGLVHLLTSPGVPMLLYGEELGLAAGVADLVPEGAWADRMPMLWTRQGRHGRFRSAVKRLLAARAASPALRRGALEVLCASGSTLAYRRRAEGEVVDVAMNGANERVEIAIDDAELPALELLAAVGDVGVRGSTVTLGPGAAIVARRQRGGMARAGRALQIATQRRRDEVFVARATGLAPPPARIDFALTERCNLKCAHCVTFAPPRTRTGRARTMTPWVLDCLRESLPFVEYAGFVHGGETLSAPIFFDVLHALRAARAGAPTVVHLLSNGMLLDEPMTARLVESGVTSISVSLDGATPQVNDRVRVGGDFRQICDHVRGAVRLRRALGADLRIGLSSVLSRTSVAQAEALVELGADLGVDWLKLEEIAPVNPFAARAFVAADDLVLRAGVARAVERGRELGIVVVDHTAPPAVWRCKLGEDEAAREFLLADEYANRSFIHPCRAVWERACVQPDGDVHLGDFSGARLGTVVEAPLSRLWNGHVAQVERGAAEARRLCGARSPWCVGT